MKSTKCLMAGLLISSALSGCASDPVVLAPSFCAVGAAIYIGEEDVLTDETARQILRYNEAGAKLCDWGK